MSSYSSRGENVQYCVSEKRILNFCCPESIDKVLIMELEEDINHSHVKYIVNFFG